MFLPGQSQGQRSLARYSSWGHKRVRVRQTQLSYWAHTYTMSRSGYWFQGPGYKEIFPCSCHLFPLPSYRLEVTKDAKVSVGHQLLLLVFIQTTISPDSLLELPDCLLPSLWLFIASVSSPTPNFPTPALGLPTSLVTYPTAFTSAPFVPVSGPDTHMVLW